jgi:hypothetical protein
MMVLTGMESTYGVVWGHPGRKLSTGRLTIAADGILLEGMQQHTHELARLVLHSRDLTGVRVGRAEEERIGGHPALVLDLVDGGSVSISAPGPGMLSEIADLLSSLEADEIEEDTRVVVVVPLRKGASAKARELIEKGPPFDPVAVGLEHHDVFVTENEVVFLFQGADAQEVPGKLISDPTLWREAVGWRSLISGKPRVADHAYHWTR